MQPAFVLIHSPLVGPLTWSLVAAELRGRGPGAVVPALWSGAESLPYWRRHASAVASAVQHVASDRPVVLVAHSGAGPLLPAIGHDLNRPVATHVFVDAALPGRDGESRLDRFPPADADRFRAAARDGLIPPVWRNDDVLRQAGIADACLRRRFAADVPDVPLAVYEEPLPVPGSWPDAPCAYVQFSAPYQSDAQDARDRGWAVRKIDGGHFHMLAEPAAVADALLGLLADFGVA